MVAERELYQLRELKNELQMGAVFRVRSSGTSSFTSIYSALAFETP